MRLKFPFLKRSKDSFNTEINKDIFTFHIADYTYIYLTFSHAHNITKCSTDIGSNGLVKC